MTPSFFIIGAPKCGTTTLAHWLEQTDSVFMSNPKEPHHYCSDYKQNWSTFRPGTDEYLGLFKGVEAKHLAVGEGSTHYLWSRDAVDNILTDIPDARFVVCLRNPVEMARSMFAHSLFWGNEVIGDFELAWRAQKERKTGQNVPPWCVNPSNLQYEEICSIGSQIERLEAKVDSENILYVFIEDLADRKAETYSKVVDFIGASASDICFDSQNITRERRSNTVNILVKRMKHVRGPKVFRKAVEVLGLLNDRYNTRRHVRQPLSKAFEEELMNVFSCEIEKVEKITNRDLSTWRAGK